MNGCRHADLARLLEDSTLSIRVEACRSGDACPWALPAARAATTLVLNAAIAAIASQAGNSVTRRADAAREIERLKALVAEVLDRKSDPVETSGRVSTGAAEEGAK